MQDKKVILEISDTPQNFVVQAYAESRRTWASITMPSSDLGMIHTAAVGFHRDTGVKTRIKIMDYHYDTLRMSEFVVANRALFDNEH